MPTGNFSWQRIWQPLKLRSWMVPRNTEPLLMRTILARPAVGYRAWVRRSRFVGAGRDAFETSAWRESLVGVLSVSMHNSTSVMRQMRWNGSTSLEARHEAEGVLEILREFEPGLADIE